MIDVTFILNGRSWSDKLSKYNVRYVPEEVQNIVTMDSTEHVTTRDRPHIIFTLMPLTDGEAADLYEDLSTGIISVTYTDTWQGSDETAPMRLYSSLDAAFGLRSIDGNRYYKGTEITLRQKTVV